MLRIVILPTAGLLLGIGGALSNLTSIKIYPFLNIGWLQTIFGAKVNLLKQKNNEIIE